MEVQRRSRPDMCASPLQAGSAPEALNCRAAGLNDEPDPRPVRDGEASAAAVRWSWPRGPRFLRMAMLTKVSGLHAVYANASQPWRQRDAPAKRSFEVRWFDG